ncbi:MAG: hypothetical protein AB1716_05480 [Planctomycetota bacterium]
MTVVEEIAAPDCDPVVDIVKHPFVVVLTQECDLESDSEWRQTQGLKGVELRHILLCEAFSEAELREQPGVNSRVWDRIHKNSDERYQYLCRAIPGHDLRATGFGPLCLDFKRCFSMPTAELLKRIDVNEAQRRGRLSIPYREHLTGRAFHFHQRVGLPAPHHRVTDVASDAGQSLPAPAYPPEEARDGE